MDVYITQGSLEFWSFWKECEEARDQTKRHDFRRNLDSWVQECNKMIKTLWNTNLLQLYHAAVESIRVVRWMLTKNPTKLNCKINFHGSILYSHGNFYVPCAIQNYSRGSCTWLWHTLISWLLENCPDLEGCLPILHFLNH